ncbi:MAG TPA: 5-formyltetrahydrofolate cyclo-ligase [Bryobacteraceae bacterium]|nr:5-formyltetrahydrofolate cyclo-ligase [Bryobacteraceae bacterium]
MSQQKMALRRQLREALRQMPLTTQGEHSTRLTERLLAQPVWEAAGAILFFVPAAGEPNLWPVATLALAMGKKVVLPSYSPATGHYEARIVADTARDLQPGQFGILEPSPASPTYNLKQLDLALVPGIGFTLNGGRLGRGKGYYDRLLEQVPGFKCGVAFDCQLVDVLPLESHDVRLNCILTPTRWHLVSAPLRS